MPDRPKRPRDANQLAKFIVDVAPGEADAGAPLEKHAAQREGGLNRPPKTSVLDLFLRNWSRWPGRPRAGWPWRMA